MSKNLSFVMTSCYNIRFTVTILEHFNIITIPLTEYEERFGKITITSRFDFHFLLTFYKILGS